MTNYASWRPIYRAMCPDPGPRDLFVVILVNGKRIGLFHIEAYPKLRETAHKLAEQHKCQVKVLPMTGEELLNFCGIQWSPTGPVQPIENMEPAFRAQAIKNCRDAISECEDARLRQDALAMLDVLGAW